MVTQVSPLPSGSITLLFTDIEGSTQLWEKHPDAMRVALARHDALLREICEEHHGYVFKTVGDAFCVAFDTPLDALNAAVACQHALAAEPWGETMLKVRMALHGGEVESRDNDYFGPPLNRVARLLSAGHGGQVLVSALIQEKIAGALPQGVTLRDMGERRLKDLIRPEHIYQLLIPGLPTDFAPLKTLDTFRTNLPAQLTSFIGREKEIDEVKQLITEQRLVTLVGSGGAGKTRLSLQVVAEMLDRFADGIWFVELAPLTDPDLVPQAILSALGLAEQAGKTALELLKEYLGNKRVLLVLDNCEHLVSSSAQAASNLLAAAPGIKILASSREALGVRGEASYPVPSLSLPDPKNPPTLEQLSHFEAARLFIERARLAAPYFVLDAESAPYIAQICYRLDGIPLALELAAARVRVLSVQQIAQRLDDRFRLLTGGMRTALPRQQTLRALVDWSYDILAEKERLLLQRFSAFSGAWTLEAAEEICSDPPGVMDRPLLMGDILDLLTQLVNKSLVNVVEQPYGRETRYRMLETIRQYAREKLLESGQGESIREKHFAYYLGKSRQLKIEFYSPKILPWLTWAHGEWDNLRAAVEWAIGSRPRDGLELVNNLGLFLMDHLHINDIEGWLSHLVPHPENNHATTARAQGLLRWAECIGLGARLTDISLAQSMQEESFSLYTSWNDKNGIANCLAQKGHFCVWIGEPNKASPLLKDALRLFRETNDKPGVAGTLFSLGFSTEWYEKENKTAYMQESLSLYRELGYVPGMIEVLKQLGAIEIRLGNFQAAHTWLDEALALFKQNSASLGQTKVVAYDVGDLAFYEGNYELAQTYYEECLAWADQVVSSVSIAYAKSRLGFVNLRRGHLPTAAHFFQDALRLFFKVNNQHGLYFTLDGLAILAVAQEHYEKAAILFACAAKSRMGPLAPAEQNVLDREMAVVHTQLSAEAFAKLTTQAQEMSTEQTVAFALE